MSRRKKSTVAIESEYTDSIPAIGVAVLAVPSPIEKLPDIPADGLRQWFSEGSPRLSILIPSLECRQVQRDEMTIELIRQCEGKPVEIKMWINNGKEPVGRTRNRLLDLANGDYIAFVDDDDKLSPDYISRILKALESSPDCVGFWVTRFRDGKRIGMAKHSLEFTVFSDRQHGPWTDYDRTPNHLNPVKASIAKEVRFVPIPEGEDRDYAARMRPLLKTQVFIDAPLYTYLQVTKR